MRLDTRSQKGRCWLYDQQGFEGELGDNRIVVVARTVFSENIGINPTEAIRFEIFDNEFEIDHQGVKILFNIEGVPSGTRRTEAERLDDLPGSPVLSFQVLRRREDATYLLYNGTRIRETELASGESVLNIPLRFGGLDLLFRWIWQQGANNNFMGAQLTLRVFIIPFDTPTPGV